MIALCGNITFSEYFECFLESKLTGEVLLSTSKGIYFQLADRIFLLADSFIGATPIGIQVDQVGFLTSLNLTPGQQIRYKDRMLYLPGYKIQLEIRENICHLEFSSSLPEQILSCAKMLQQHSNPRGVSSLVSRLFALGDACSDYANPLCEAAYPLLTMLIQGLKERDAGKTDDAVRQLIGMGIGLTPSLDDVMLGMLYALLRLAPGSKATELLRSAVIRHAPGKTNDISAAYLKAVANGAPFQRLDEILRSLAGYTPLDIQPLLSIGSSSGSEMLLGLLLAAKIAVKNTL